MSIECGECEMDLRGGHADDCSRAKSTTWRGFVCWDADAEDVPPDDAPKRNRVTDALSIEGAAERFAERIHSSSDYFTEATIMVRDPQGVVHTVDVTVESVPSSEARVRR